jgi:cation diffusion facilitator family transporter
MVLFASKFGSQAADDSHPYGHQRIETAATLLLALLLILTGLGIAWDSLEHILHQHIKVPHILALPIAIFSILANELLFYKTKQVGEKIKSALIIANAWHHRSDSAASLIVLLGIMGSFFGWTFLDQIAAIFVGYLIIKMGTNYGWDSFKELVDTSVDPTQISEITRAINRVDGVVKIHQLRNRKMGSDLLIDVHILVEPWISVSEGHQIAQRVHYSLMTNIDHVKDVIVHVDPEDDELISPSKDLPSRAFLESAFLNDWSQRFSAIQGYILHYLNGSIAIDVQVREPFEQWGDLQAQTHQDLLNYPVIGSIRFLLEKK